MPEQAAAAEPTRHTAPGGAPPQSLDQLLAERPHTDLGNAERFIARHLGRVRHVPALGALGRLGRPQV